ncbi:unnamed protein product [Echinostoma caproni]|uniref:Dehydrogenase/reductase SDR family member 1 n=1 Tax=Echinostoma caproni TaxID=27848 RepID=A0A183AAJ4_9TREM|nr:unnamed protein product [Echinostoma caproni]
MSSLKDHICLVTGASRGIGRGIAIGLGERGATVYITGRTLKSTDADESGLSLESTAAEIKSRGGVAIPVAVDHSNEKQVTALFERIQREQKGRLDVLVNNAFAAVSLIRKTHKKAFYEFEDVSPGEAWDIVNNVGLRNNYVCATLAARMMVNYQRNLQEQGHPENLQAGLIVNVSSVGAKTFLFSTLYGVGESLVEFRTIVNNVYLCLPNVHAGKCGIDRMSHDMAIELKQHNNHISVISLWPGVVRTEHMLETESPELSGRVVAHLAAEPDAIKLARSGQVILVSDVATQYGIMDTDGKPPAHMRSLRTLLYMGGYSLASMVPSFVRIPKSLFMYMLSWR